MDACIGPILAGILTLPELSRLSCKDTILLAVLVLGLAGPFLLTSWDKSFPGFYGPIHSVTSRIGDCERPHGRPPIGVLIVTAALPA